MTAARHHKQAAEAATTNPQDDTMSEADITLQETVEAALRVEIVDAASRIRGLFAEWAELDRIQTSGECGTITQRARWAGLEAEIDSLLHALSFTAHPAPMDRVPWRANARISNYATA